MTTATYGSGIYGTDTYGPAATVGQQIEVRLSTKSGSAGNSLAATPAESLGKWCSQTVLTDNLPNNLFADFTQAQAEAGRTVYRCLFAYNSGPTDWEPVLYVFARDPGTDAQVLVAYDDTFGATAVDAGTDQATYVADDVATGKTWEFTFGAPRRLADAVALGVIAAGDVRAFWVKIECPAESRARRNDWATLRLYDAATDVEKRFTLVWSIEPTEARIAAALAGEHGPVSYGFRYEKRSVANVFEGDVSAIVTAGSIELDNSRDILRTGSFTVDPALDATVDFDPLTDHLAPFMDLLVDGSYTWPFQLGLFAANLAPRRRHRPGSSVETWAASDLALHLLEETVTAAYTVASGANYITGTNGVQDIIDRFGLQSALPNTSATLPVAMTWAPGTSYLAIATGLLRGAGMYALWFDVTGVARTRTLDELSARTFDVQYSGETFVLAGDVEEERETSRFANQIIAIIDDPARGVLSSVKTNSDPDSPTSTVSLGRTITRVIAGDRAADQDTLDLLAERELQASASMFRKVGIATSIDPRRDGHEVYGLDLGAVYEGTTWWCRSWAMELKTGGTMRHQLGEVERVVAS